METSAKNRPVLSPEVTWRVDLLRDRLPADAPWTPAMTMVRGGNPDADHCLSCHDPLPPDSPRAWRCRDCIIAIRVILQEHEQARHLATIPRIEVEDFDL